MSDLTPEEMRLLLKKLNANRRTLDWAAGKSLRQLWDICDIPAPGMNGPVPITRQEAILAALHLASLASKTGQGSLSPETIRTHLHGRGTPDD